MDLVPEVQIALIGGVVSITTLFINKLVKDRNSTKKHCDTNVSLEYHPLFSRMDALDTYIKNGFHIENKGKEVVFKNLLEKRIAIWKEQLFQLAKEMDECCNNCNETDCIKLYSINMKYYNISYESSSNYYASHEYTCDEQKVLSIVMDKFVTWDRDRSSRMEANIESICNSKFYSDCRVKQAVIFDIYIGYFVDMINDAEKTLDSINGDLKGLVFKNIKL